MSKIGQYYKAIVGAIAPGAVTLVAAVQDSSAGGSAITTAEWVTAACACIITGAGVAAVTNKPAP
jgi:hypothetical protein